jgi:hypothetical protein
MMTDLADLAATLLANFRTVRIPSPEGLERPPPADWWATAKARRAEHRAAYDCRDQIRRGLVEHGYRRFLHHMESDPAGGWRLHIFLGDEAALTLLDKLTERECGPGDPVNFDPEEFVAGRLRDLFPHSSDDS